MRSEYIFDTRKNYSVEQRALQTVPRVETKDCEITRTIVLMCQYFDGVTLLMKYDPET